MQKKFIPAFEPIRGIAALIVAMMHSFFVLIPTSSFHGSYLIAKIPQIVFNGFAAVTVFFILSGIVLGLALDRYPGGLFSKWIQFQISRFFRIYPMIFVVTAIISMYLMMFHQIKNYPVVTDWFNRFYQSELDWNLALKNLLLIDVSLNPVAWTLMVEVGMAIIFPLMHSFARRNSRTENIAIVFALILVALQADLLKRLFPNMPYVNFSVLLLSHAYQFYMGLILPSFVSGNKWLSCLEGNYSKYFIITGSILITARVAAQFIGIGGGWAVLIESVAAALLLLPFCNFNSDLVRFRILEIRIIKWLGRISYSFYLWHFVILYSLVVFFVESYPWLFLNMPSFLGSLFLAVVSVVFAGIVANYSYLMIEVRFVNYGRLVLRKLWVGV